MAELTKEQVKAQLRAQGYDVDDESPPQPSAKPSIAPSVASASPEPPSRGGSAVSFQPADEYNSKMSAEQWWRPGQRFTDKIGGAIKGVAGAAGGFISAPAVVPYRAGHALGQALWGNRAKAGQEAMDVGRDIAGFAPPVAAIRGLDQIRSATQTPRAPVDYEGLTSGVANVGMSMLPIAHAASMQLAKEAAAAKISNRMDAYGDTSPSDLQRLPGPHPPRTDLSGPLDGSPYADATPGYQQPTLPGDVGQRINGFVPDGGLATVLMRRTAKAAQGATKAGEWGRRLSQIDPVDAALGLSHIDPRSSAIDAQSPNQYGRMPAEEGLRSSLNGLAEAESDSFHHRRLYNALNEAGKQPTHALEPGDNFLEDTYQRVSAEPKPPVAYPFPDEPLNDTVLRLARNVNASNPATTPPRTSLADGALQLARERIKRPAGPKTGATVNDATASLFQDGLQPGETPVAPSVPPPTPAKSRTSKVVELARSAAKGVASASNVAAEGVKAAGNEAVRVAGKKPLLPKTNAAEEPRPAPAPAAPATPPPQPFPSAPAQIGAAKAVDLSPADLAWAKVREARMEAIRASRQPPKP